MGDSWVDFARGAAYLLRKRVKARAAKCRREYTRSRIEFWKKHQVRVEKRIEILESRLPRKTKKKMSKILID